MNDKKVGINVEKLIKRNKLSIEHVAQKIEIESKTLENKIMGNDEFTPNEIVKLMNLFNLSSKQCSKIFFP